MVIPLLRVVRCCGRAVFDKTRWKRIPIPRRLPQGITYAECVPEDQEYIALADI